MAKGAQSKDKDGKFLPFGNYLVDLGMACNTDTVDLPEIPITVAFEYLGEDSLYEDNVIKVWKSYTKNIAAVRNKIQTICLIDNS